MSLANWNALTPAQQEKLLDSPALAAPPGITPDFDNPPNLNTLCYAVTIVAVTLTTIAFLLRAYSRVVISKTVYIEDGLALLAFGSYIGLIWGTLKCVATGGFFVHQWNVTIGVLLDLLYPFYLIPLFYAFTLFFIKIAILREWLRVFVPPGVRNLFFWVCWVVLILNFVFYTGSILALGVSCLPAKKFWMPWTPGRCFSPRSFEYASSIINLVLDLVMLSLPQRVIWTLNMSPKTKVGMSLIYSIGLLACASAFGRTIVGARLIETKDRTYVSAGPILFTVAESTSAILIFCIPATPKVFRHVTPFPITVHSLRSWTRIWTRNQSSSTRRAASSHEEHVYDPKDAPEVPDLRVQHIKISDEPEHPRTSH